MATVGNPCEASHRWDCAQGFAAWKRSCRWGLRIRHWFSCTAKDMQTADWNKYDDRLMKAAERGDVDKVSTVLAKKGINPCKLDLEGRSAFHVVASKGNLDCLNSILLHGTDITASDAAGRNALHLSAKYGHSLCLQKLLQFNCPTENVDLQGRTALHDAAMSDCRSSVQLLCDHGACVNAKDGDGRTPLVLATQMCRPAICQLLIDKGADVNAGDKQNKTALMLGCEYGCKDAVEVLLKNGADATMVDVLGHDSSYYARIGDNLEILALIRAAVENSSKGRESQKIGPLVQMKWHQQNSQEEGSVKSPRSTHSMQDLEMENEDLRERLWKIQQEQRLLFDRVSGLQLQLSQKEELKMLLTTKEKEEEESTKVIEALKAKLRFYESNLVAYGGLTSNGKEDLLGKGVAMAVQQHTQMSVPSHLQPRSLLRPLELAGLGQAAPADMDALRRYCEGAKEEVTKLQQELAHKSARCDALAAECEQTQLAADSQIRELEDALKDVQKRMFDSEGKVKQMQCQFLALKEHLSQETLAGGGRLAEELQEKLGEMKSKYEGTSAEVGRLRNLLRQQELLAEELRREEVRLSQENRRLHEEGRTSKSEREQAACRLQELQVQLKDMASQLSLCVTAERFGNMKSLLTNEVNEKAKQVAAVERELAEQQQEAKELQDQVSMLASQVQSSVAEAEDARAAAEQLRQQLAAAKQAQQVPLRQHTQLKKSYEITVAGLQAQLADATREQEQLLQSIDHLQATYISPELHEKETAAMKSNLVQLQRQLEELVQSHGQEQAKARKLEAANAELQAHAQEVALSESIAGEREEAVRQECAQLTEAHAKLAQQLADVQRRTCTDYVSVQEHREKVAALEKQVTQAQARRECDQGEIAALRAATKAQNQELDTIQQCIRLKYTPVASAQEQEQRLQATVNELKQQLSEQEQVVKEKQWESKRLQAEMLSIREREQVLTHRVQELSNALQQLQEEKAAQRDHVPQEQFDAMQQTLQRTIKDLQEKLHMGTAGYEQELKALRQQQQQKTFEHMQLKEALERDLAASQNHLAEKETAVQVKDTEISKLQTEIQSIRAALEEMQGKQDLVRAELESQASSREKSVSILQEKYQQACEEATKARRKEQAAMEARQALQARSSCIEQEIRELTERYDHSLATIGNLQGSIQDSAKQLETKDNKITELLNDVENLKQALNGLTQLTYSSGVPRAKQESQQTDVLQRQVKALQQQLAESEKQHQEVISVYRAHLLSAVQGRMDEDVQAALLQIVRMRRELVC
ncbi:uveal autoantigen with coiled-coil domains and ankyrin repeats isoform X3 [Rhinatrema bivittatum]|uniref:uveal autoantigen with coiled-coil domains and ankyrin repeats isoform X3 n=1 Tax=Rhinatrema bivittatum TaxID=194408 RepID=UPI00112B33FB|nr:uveal autoantigen with coiled-coil domains and ankyrin repeats isoform X3 [Rhinatrema bivittatum]